MGCRHLLSLSFSFSLSLSLYIYLSYFYFFFCALIFPSVYEISSSFLFASQFNFKSYSAEDDDYEGYDYSLRGRFAAVRIVFLYRFVQEVCLTLLTLFDFNTNKDVLLLFT